MNILDNSNINGIKAPQVLDIAQHGQLERVSKFQTKMKGLSKLFE